MQIELRVFATYRKPVAEFLGLDTTDVIFLELPAQSTLADLIAKVGLQGEQSIIPLVNGERAEPSVVLKDGDRVGLFPPVGGG